MDNDSFKAMRLSKFSAVSLFLSIIGMAVSTKGYIATGFLMTVLAFVCSILGVVSTSKRSARFLFPVVVFFIAVLAVAVSSAFLMITFCLKM